MTFKAYYDRAIIIIMQADNHIISYTFCYAAANVTSELPVVDPQYYDKLPGGELRCLK